MVYTKKTTNHETQTKSVKKDRYVEANGGRKTASARVRIFQNKSGMTINGKDLKNYFSQEIDRKTASAPLETLSLLSKVMVSAKVNGGGIGAQAEAIRNAIARALVKFSEEFRKPLRASGYLTRDSRMVERKKYGLKKARKSPQWQKR